MRDHLQQLIQQQGPLSFAEYMQQALYAPGLGYYQTRNHLLGVEGDFVTAPEISPLFGQCLAQQAAQVLDACGDQAVILEFGPGRGCLARDLLLHLAEHDLPLPKHYYLLDVSSHLREQQQQTLSALPEHLAKRVQWLDSLPTANFSGLLLANEVLDAMPVHQFVWQDGACFERYVDWQAGPAWCLRPASSELLKAVQAIQTDWSDGYYSEVNLSVGGWLAALTEHWQQGILLAIDYGFPQREYYHPSRDQGTVMCHRQQRSHPDPLHAPGQEDITSHVDFTHVAECANAQDLQVLGYASQASFLLNCGLAELIPPADTQANQAVKLLTLPHEMGELFKVLALGKAWPDQPLQGFQSGNQLARL